MTTLYFEEKVNTPEETIVSKNTEKELNLAIKIIEDLSGKFTPDKYKDEYQDNIKNAIDDKLNGKDIKAKRKKPREQVNNLMEALEKSLKKKK